MSYQVIQGEAEPAAIEAFVKTARASSTNWASYANATIDDALGRYAVERKESLNSGTFHHSNHGAFFVQAVANIHGNIAPEHRKCVERLISMDPISTFFILLDPQRNDAGLNNAVAEALRKMTYMERDAAKSAYKAAFNSSCDSISNIGEILGALNKLKRPAASNTINGLQEHVKGFYQGIAADGKYDGVDFYGCLSAATRGRIQVYDDFRYALSIVEMDLYPCCDATDVASIKPLVADEDKRQRGLALLVKTYLCGPAPSFQDSSIIVIQDARDHAECAQFICSDFFPFVPMNRSTCDKFMSSADDSLKTLGLSADDFQNNPIQVILKNLSLSRMIPFCMTRHAAKVFDQIF